MPALCSCYENTYIRLPFDNLFVADGESGGGNKSMVEELKEKDRKVQSDGDGEPLVPSTGCRHRPNNQ